MRALSAETVSVAKLHAYLRARGAVFLPEKNPPGAKSHIYYSGPLKRWVRVKRNPKNPAQEMLLEYFSTCPCAFS